MTLWDVDKAGDTRGAPTLNQADTLVQLRAHGTTSLIPVTDATSAAFAQTAVKTGAKQLLTSGTATVTVTIADTNISQTNVALSGSLTNISVEASVVPPYYITDSAHFSYTVFQTPYPGKEFTNNPSAWISLSASSKGQPQTINFYVIPNTNSAGVGNWVFTYYVYRQAGDQS